LQEEDIEKLAACSAIFAPESLYHKPQDARDTDAAMVVDSHKTIDLDAHCTWVAVENLSRGLCAGSRPHFFRGVCTIVCKLFNIVDPDMAFFGKKDYQQWRVLERMARDLDFDIEIVGVPIFREPDGLAMSSRNLLLTSENRQNALSIYRALSKAKTNRTSIRDISVSKIKEEVAMEIIAAGGRIDYVEVVNSKSLAPVNSVVESDQPVLVAVAAFFGSVRLIDNTEI